MENEVRNRKEGLRFVSYGALEEADSQNSLLITQMPVLYSRHSFVDFPTARLKLRQSMLPGSRNLKLQRSQAQFQVAEFAKFDSA
jgi:hypothetical protein